MFDLYGYGYYLFFWLVQAPFVFLVFFVTIIAVIVSFFSRKKPKKKLSEAEIMDRLITVVKDPKSDTPKILESVERFKKNFSDFEKHKMVEKGCEFLHHLTLNHSTEIELATQLRDELVEKNSGAKDAIQKSVNTALKEREKHNKKKK